MAWLQVCGAFGVPYGASKCEMESLVKHVPHCNIFFVVLNKFPEHFSGVTVCSKWPPAPFANVRLEAKSSSFQYIRYYLPSAHEKVSDKIFVHPRCLCRYSRVQQCLPTTFLNVGGDRVGHAPSLGYDHLDGGIGRLHTNFQISATLSKKVLIFSQKGHFPR